MLFFYVNQFTEASMRTFSALAVFILVFAATAVHADFYRWVDRDGREFFSNDLEKVPRNTGPPLRR
jgi:hypothetical protein